MLCIYGRFMGFYVNGFLKGLSFTHQCRCSPMLIFLAWATCGGSTTNFVKVILSSIRGQTQKPDVNLFFTIIKAQKSQNTGKVENLMMTFLN